MVSFPLCKINLGLHVLSKREDGFHDLETCFYPVPWTDVLEIIPANQNTFHISGNLIFGKDEDNLCVRAYKLLKEDFRISPIKIHLHKIIPAGAGLGGGSADAAYTLKTLNTIFSLGLSKEALLRYASQLGSDCPFFVDPQPQMGTGKGELLAPFSLMLDNFFLVLVTPDIHVSTTEAYQGVIPAKPLCPISDILRKPVFEWKEKLVNDFEPSVFRKHPLIKEIKDQLYQLGADYASMSGSGASVFGLFGAPINLQNAFAGMQVWSGILSR